MTAISSRVYRIKLAYIAAHKKSTDKWSCWSVSTTPSKHREKYKPKYLVKDGHYHNDCLQITCVAFKSQVGVKKWCRYSAKAHAHFKNRSRFHIPWNAAFKCQFGICECLFLVWIIVHVQDHFGKFDFLPTFCEHYSFVPSPGISGHPLQAWMLTQAEPILDCSTWSHCVVASPH